MKKLKKRVFVLLFILVIGFNSVNVQYAEATSPLIVTIEAILSGVGGAALSVVAPILLVLSLGYAGYTVYDNWDFIEAKALDWYSESPPFVKLWIDTMVQDFATGVIKLGDVIDIPKEIMDNAKAWVNTDATTVEGVTVISNGKQFVNVTEALPYITNSGVRDWINSKSTVVSQAPLVIYTPKDYPDRQMVFWNTADLWIGSNHYPFDTLVLANLTRFHIAFSSTDIYGTSQVTNNGTYLNNTAIYNAGIVWQDFYGTMQPVDKNYSNVDSYIPVLPYASGFTMNGNVLSSASWNYDIRIIVPDDTKVIFNTMSATVGNIIDDSTSTVMKEANIPIVPSAKPYAVSEKTFVPEWVIDDVDGKEKYPYVLTPSALQKIYDMLISKTLASTDAFIDDLAGVDDTVDEEEKKNIPYVLDLHGTVSGIKDKETQINNDFNTAWGDLDLDFSLPGYVLSGMTFVSYVFSGIWTGYDDYILIVVFAITIGLVGMIIGRGLVRNSHSSNSKSKGGASKK